MPTARLAPAGRPPTLPRRAPRRPIVRPLAATKHEPGGGTLVAAVVQTFNHAASSLLPGPWRFAPSLLLPSAGGLSVVGALHAPAAVHALAGALPEAVVAALPAAPTVAAFYAAHGPAVDAVLSTAAGSIGVAAGFVLLPLLDALLGDEADGDLAPADAPDAAFRAWLYAAGGAHLALVAAGIAAAPALAAAHADAGPALAAAPVLAVALSAGTSGGTGFTVAHELVHGRSRADRVGAAALLSAACYGWWRDAHLAHHKNVGLHHDPATARRGETLYRFIPRSVLGGLADGLAADRARVAAKGWAAARAPLWVAGPAAWLAASAAVGGAPAVAFFLVQAAGSVFLLETVNFLEHYGLERKIIETTLPDGTIRRVPERVEPHHSWNANTLCTNAVSFRLQRHSDHHAHAERPFYRLRDLHAAPQLPKHIGYSGTMLMAAFAPALFAKVMEARLEEENERVASMGVVATVDDDE